MDYKAFFTTSPDDLGVDAVVSYLNILNTETKRHITTSSPCIENNQLGNPADMLKNCSLGNEGTDPTIVLKELADLTAGLPLWNHPGTMLNVIPPVNLVATAAGAFSDLLNVNYSQGHYSGNLAFAEFKVVKYVSDLVEWDWTQSGGIFTFGGKGTSLYALKNALNRAYPPGKENGYDKKFFFLSSVKGHPCHAEVAEWLGIGKSSCIRVPTSNDGKIKLSEAEKVIVEKLEKGYVFLGCILSGGSTVEFEVDDISAVRELMERIRKDYSLPYRPWIHVDSVVGWPWLFFNDYDFEENELELSAVAKQRIRSLNNDVRAIREADSFGADFHKTGFCSYVSSLFMCKSAAEFCRVSNDTGIDGKNIDLGAYSPFEYSLELSRSAKGAISAMVALETMGKNGYRQLIADMIENTHDVRQRLAELPFVELLNPTARGFASLFVIKPPQYESLCLTELLNLAKEDTEIIKKYNVRFGNYIADLVVRNQSTINLTATDAFAVNNTNVFLGMLKIYPMSVQRNSKTNEFVVAQLCNYKAQFDALDQNIITDATTMDMVYRK